MKLLIVSIKNPFAAKDGGSLAMMNILEGYHQLGYSITLLIMNPLQHNYNLKHYNQQIERLNIKVIEFKINTNIKPLNALKNLLFSQLPYNLERFLNADFRELLENTLKQNHFDIVQFESSFLGLYIDSVRKFSTKSRLVLRAHNLEYEIWERNVQVQKSLWKRKYFKIIAERFKNWEIKTFSKYDAILPITNRDEDHIREYAPMQPYFTLPFTIDIENYPKQEISLKNLSIAYLGALDWIPNQESLIWFLKNVWKRIQDYYEGLEFFIAGRSAPEWIQKEIRNTTAKYVGEVDDAKEFILSHPIFVVPLLSGSGMRIKIIEQMALGRIVISTPIGAEGIEIVNMENAIIADDPNDFIKAIDYLFRNPDGIRYISTNARLTIENLYDSKEVFPLLDKFLNQLLNQN